MKPQRKYEHQQTPGARPTGISDPAAAAQNIQKMFDTIAPTYDRANHILSFSLDRLWWNRTALTLRPILELPEAVVLDLCCGTGDMTLALDEYRPRGRSRMDREVRASDDLVEVATSFPVREKQATATANTEIPGFARNDDLDRLSGELPAPILAIDFSHNMLALAMPKFAGRNILPVEADALHLPIPSNSIDLVTAAFGFRNLASYPDGLTELHRILRPGGEIAILEANQPDGLTGALYSLYFKRVLPVLGGLISRNRSAYAYLPDSVGRFPRPPRMKELIAAAGFINPTWTRYTFGTAGLYRARKP